MEDKNRPDFNLETCTLQEARDEYAWLRDELLTIDQQLVERKNTFLQGPRKPHEEAQAYYNWRSSAVGAKSVKVRQISLVRDKLSELQRQPQADSQTVRLSIPVEHAVALRVLIEVAFEQISMDSDAHERLDFIDQLLASKLAGKVTA